MPGAEPTPYPAYPDISAGWEDGVKVGRHYNHRPFVVSSRVASDHVSNFVPVHIIKSKFTKTRFEVVAPHRLEERWSRYFAYPDMLRGEPVRSLIDHLEGATHTPVGDKFTHSDPARMMMGRAGRFAHVSFPSH